MPQASSRSCFDPRAIVPAKRNSCCLLPVDENLPKMSPSPCLIFMLVAALALAGLVPTAVRAAETATASPAALDTVADTRSSDTRTTDALASKATYEQRVNELANRAAPYDAQLSEAWLGLGTALQTLEQHEEAIEALGNGMQALRISNGLVDPQQIPLLQQQLASYEALQQWEALDAAYHLINYIAQKQYSAGAQPRFDALLQLGRWKLKAASEHLLAGALDEAAVAAELYRKEIGHLQTTGTDNKTQLATYCLELAAAEYIQVEAINQQPLSNFETSTRSSTTQMQCQAVRLADGRVSQICTTVEVPNMNGYLLSSQRKGQELSMHLEAMRAAVMDGYYALQDASVAPEQRNTLLPEMQRLTGEYNKFMQENGSADNPRLQR